MEIQFSFKCAAKICASLRPRQEKPPLTCTLTDLHVPQVEISPLSMPVTEGSALQIHLTRVFSVILWKEGSTTYEFNKNATLASVLFTHPPTIIHPRTQENGLF